LSAAGTALITGASSGIGRSLARLFARGGHDVVLVARRESSIESLAEEVRGTGRAAHAFAADLSENHSAEALRDRIGRARIQVDVLVNNAGVGLQGRFDELPLDRQLSMLQLNVTSLTTLTRLYLPEMIARNTGGILNVASTAAFQPGPLMAVYYASKAFVLSFTEALAAEVSGTALKVSCLCPGPTRTGFVEAAGLQGSRLFTGGAMSADDVARVGYDGWNAGKRLVIPGVQNRLGTLLVRFTPRALVPRITKRLNQVE
jgi:short-subunit dehydrogenase